MSNLADTMRPKETPRQSSSVRESISAVFFNTEDGDKPFGTVFLRQLMAALAPSLLFLCSGMVFGYTTVTFPKWRSSGRVRLTVLEESLAASVLLIPMTIGGAFGKHVMRQLGAQLVHLVASMYHIAAWLLLYFTTNSILIICSRFVSGLVIAFSLPVSIAYLQQSIGERRCKVFMPFMGASLCLGILLCHVVCIFSHEKYVPLYATVAPGLAIILFVILPESQMYYAKYNHVFLAKKSYVWYRGNDVLGLRTFAAIVQQLSSEKPSKSIKLYSECQTKEFATSVFTACLAFLALQLSGSNIVIFFSVDLINKISRGGYKKTLYLDAIRLGVVLMLSILKKPFHTRKLALVSLFGTSLILLTTATITLLASYYPNFRYHTVIFICLGAHTAFLGVSVTYLPWIITSRIFSAKCENIGIFFSVVLNYVLFFLTTFFTPYLLRSDILYVAFFCIAAALFLSSTALYYYLPDFENTHDVKVGSYFMM